MWFKHCLEISKLFHNKKKEYFKELDIVHKKCTDNLHYYNLYLIKLFGSIIILSLLLDSPLEILSYNSSFLIPLSLFYLIGIYLLNIYLSK